MDTEFSKYLGKRLPFSSDPKYQGFKKYVLQSVERGEKIMDSIVPHLSLENKKILDIGCADGGVAVAFAKAGCQVTALDLNPDNIAMAKLRAQEENVSLNFLEQKAEEIDFPLHSFDGVIMNDFLEYTLDARLILKKLGSIIKPGGFCYIAVLYWFNKKIRGVDHQRFYFYWELCRLLKKNGFSPIFMDSKPWRRPFRSYWKILAIKNRLV